MIVEGSSSSLASGVGGSVSCEGCWGERCEKQVEMGDEAEEQTVE